MDTFEVAQQAQNDFAGTGEDVQAITQTQNGTTTSRETFPGSGVFVDTAERVYQVRGNVIVSTTGVVGNFV